MASPGEETRANEVRLRVVAGPGGALVGTELVVGPAGAWIGRDASCELHLPDDSVSRRHARLEVTAEGSLVVKDNKSANGVLVGGRRVDEIHLKPGGLFTIGQTTLERLAEAATSIEAGTLRLEGLAELAAQLEAPKLLSEQGEEVTALANQPFLMSDSSSLWWVESGKVEIFTVAVEGGEPTGSRRHFLSIEPGSVFAGLDTARFGHDWGFLAVGKAGSRLRRFDFDRLQLLALVPEHREAIADAIEGWVRALTRRLAAEIPPPPSGSTVLAPGQKAELEVGKAAISAGGSVAWLVLPPEFLLYDGMANLSPEQQGLLFPLAGGGWLERLGEAKAPKLALAPLSTHDAIRDARLWPGLDVFHRVACECEGFNQQVAMADEVVRLDRKAARAASARAAGIGAIEAVLGGTRVWGEKSVAADLGPVYKACARVAEAIGTEVRMPLGDLEELTFEEKVLAIAAASHFRVRQVALADDWWTQDQGPMVARREKSGEPVAILTTKPGVYDVVDPESGQRRRLTETLAAQLAPFAFTFYRPFDDGPLTARDLARFSLSGLSRELREVAFAGILVGLCSTVTPTITGMVFDNAIPQAERSLLIQLSMGLLLIAFGTAAFKITQNVAMLRVQSVMDYSAQAAVWDRLLNLPVTFFRRFSAGDLADRASAIDKMRSIIAGTGVAALLGTFASLFNAVQMCLYNVTLALVAIGLTLGYVGFTTTTNWLKLRRQREEMTQRGKLTGLVLQLITGVPKLRVSGTEPHAFRVWATEFAQMRQTAFRVGRISNFMPVFNAAFPLLSSMAIFFTVVTLKAKALERGETFDLSTGDFLAFNAAYGIFLGAMQALGDASVGLLNVVPVYERLRPILEETPEVDRSKQAPARLRGGIEISHLYFRYAPDAPHVLRDVSLKIAPGEFVAIVGGSGSGKSTLLRLMLGFERPEKGAVYFDGQDLSTLDVRLVRQQLGVVLQESRLLPADIFRNIVGSSSRTIADAWEAARAAGLADDIQRMPMGMHTYVSEGGGGFSGGQKQRLMIARALVHGPKILFLDEATSALDNNTQAIVTESMSRLQATRVVIAHRLSTIVDADRICYLENGVIVEMGSYAELMAKDGAFARLAKRQLA